MGCHRIELLFTFLSYSDIYQSVRAVFEEHFLEVQRYKYGLRAKRNGASALYSLVEEKSSFGSYSHWFLGKLGVSMCIR